MSPESLVPTSHPIRRVKMMADEALRALSPVFEAMYSGVGRPSIPPERLLKATLLMAFYTIRSERQFCEQLEYNMLFRWFLDMDMVEPGFDHSTFTRNRERLLAHDVASKFFGIVVQQAKRAKLMSSEHFTVDGTLIEAWASMKSFKKKDSDDDGPPDDRGNPSVDFRGEKRSNDTHESSTDPESRLAKKAMGAQSHLSFSGHALMENRNGLLCDFRIAEANGRAEREVALKMISADRTKDSHRITLGADKGYDTREFVRECRAHGVVPHVAQHTTRSRGGSAIDGRTTHHAGYVISICKRKRVEEIFGWIKCVGGFRKTRLKGIAKTQLLAYFVGAAYNLLRIAKLVALNERLLGAT